MVFVPGIDPQAAMTKLSLVAGCHPVLVVDQFEELFTLADSDGRRCRSAGLAGYASRRRPVVVSVRADHLAGLPSMSALPAWPN